MENKLFSHRFRQFSIKFSAVLFCALLFGLANTFAVYAQDENFESSDPVLITEANSAKALTADADNWRGTLPRSGFDGKFSSGSRVVFFITNLDLLPNENEGAFRAFAKDAKGKMYRLVVENIQPVRFNTGIYGITVRLYDENAYNGQPPDDELLINISWRGNISNKVLLNTDKSGTKFKDQADFISNQTEQNAIYSSVGDRIRFMEQATFGVNNALDLKLRQIGIRRWINDQFEKPYPTIPYPNFPLKPFDGINSCGEYDSSPEVNLCHRNHYWNYNNTNWMVKEALYGDDQLRRRVSWTLHKIWVVSHANISQQRGTQEYIEILDRNAFGNYRDLMYEMTLSPAMGEYLDMVRSTRQNPNENYPRELLQLFSIGLYMLNQDGTLMLDGQGNRIPTYDQAKIEQFTKVFTGWTHCNNGNNSACSNAVVGIPNYIDPMYLATPNNHDQTAKSLFNYAGAPNQTIAACTNCTTDDARRAYANDSLNKTLDNVFYHPNVAPFVGKLMIQHLVTSDPSPAYVGRVAAAFNNNGAGVRGDMKAVIKAVLLDPEARGSRKTDPTYGKLREPLQYLTNLLRTFNVRAGNNGSNSPPSSCQNRSDGVFDWMTREMGQEVWMPPTVFSYYSPEYVVPGTDILGPEFALANTGTSFSRNNYIFLFSFWNLGFGAATTSDPYPYVPCGTSIDKSEAVAWLTADPSGNALIEGLNRKMMHGTMSDAMKSKIRAAINFNVDANSKVSQAIFLVASSSQYQIQR